MKRILLLIMLGCVVMLAACGNDTDASENDKSKGTNEPTQEELDNQLKNEAVEFDRAKFQDEGYEKGDRIFVTGKVSVAGSEEEVIQGFTLNSAEWIFEVKNFSENKVNKGDKVKVYGTYDGKNDGGLPVINSTVVER